MMGLQPQEKQDQKSDIAYMLDDEKRIFANNFDNTKQLFYQNLGDHQIKLLAHHIHGLITNFN
tara:strand:- start:396 stop:584 length:189 start_codon:yes stop_codon:yes gene_type:complete